MCMLTHFADRQEKVRFALRDFEVELLYSLDNKINPPESVKQYKL